MDNELRLCGIMADKVNEIWPKIEKMLTEAVKYSDGKFRIEDIFQLLLSRDMQLWTVVDNKENILSSIVTQVVNFPRKNVMFIMFIAGIRFNDWASLVSHLIQFAKAHNCETIEGYGRDGWETKSKHLGFTKVHTIYSLSLWGREYEKNMDENRISVQ